VTAGEAIVTAPLFDGFALSKIAEVGDICPANLPTTQNHDIHDFCFVPACSPDHLPSHPQDAINVTEEGQTSRGL
jgi:hypothetical protein